MTYLVFSFNQRTTNVLWWFIYLEKRVFILVLLASFHRSGGGQRLALALLAFFIQITIDLAAFQVSLVVNL